jgi:hypothetical protein
MSAKGCTAREVGRESRAGGEKDTGKKMAARGEGALEVARETWGIAEVFSVFTYKGVECWPRHARVDGVAGAAQRGAAVA